MYRDINVIYDVVNSREIPYAPLFPSVLYVKPLKTRQLVAQMICTLTRVQYSCSIEHPLLHDLIVHTWHMIVTCLSFFALQLIARLSLWLDELPSGPQVTYPLYP